MYVTTPYIQQFLRDQHLQERCQAAVALSGCLPAVRDIYEVLTAFVAGVTVEDVCSRLHPRLLGIDERKLLQFGVLEGLIRRMQKYPVQLVTSEASFSRLPQQQLPQRQLSKYLDGSQCFDEISCHTGLSFSDIDERIENDVNTVVCYK